MFLHVWNNTAVLLYCIYSVCTAGHAGGFSLSEIIDRFWLSQTYSEHNLNHVFAPQYNNSFCHQSIYSLQIWISAHCYFSCLNESIENVRMELLLRAESSMCPHLWPMWKLCSVVIMSQQQRTSSLLPPPPSTYIVLSRMWEFICKQFLCLQRIMEMKHANLQNFLFFYLPLPPQLAPESRSAEVRGKFPFGIWCGNPASVRSIRCECVEHLGALWRTSCHHMLVCNISWRKAFHVVSNVD